MKIIELFDSREITVGRVGNESSVELRYGILDTEDETQVAFALSSVVLAEWEVVSLTGDTYTLPFQNYRIKHQGAGVWEAVVRYGTRKQFEYSFDFTGGTVKITQSLETVNSYVPAERDIIDFKGAINVNNNKVDGVDIESPKNCFTLKRYFDGPIPTDFNDVLEDANRKVNSLTIMLNHAGKTRIWSAGELLFLGAQGTDMEDGVSDVTMRFAVSRNQLNIPVGTDALITVEYKDGWDYAWVAYEEKQIDAGVQKFRIMSPRQVTVERLLDRTDLGILFL